MKRYRITSSWTFIKIAKCGSAAALLLCQTVLGQTIPNPSFETDTFTVSPGYISGNTPITGWTGTPAERVGLNPSGGSPFADNGTIPAGNNVAFIQVNVSDPLTPSTLSTTISGLTVGTTYKVTFRANARNGQTPNIKVYVDGAGVLLPGGPDGLSTASVGGSNPYWYVAFEFTAAAASQTLSLVNDAAGDQTLLVDDFKIAPSTGKWSIAAWTGDGDSGADPAYLYTHAYNFGSSASAVINNINFTGVAGGAPAVPGQFSTTYLATGPLHDALTFVGENSATLAGDFVYGGDVPAGLFQSITVLGLTAGTDYVVTVYSVAFEDASVGSRWATFSVGNDYLTLNQDQFMNNNGIRISYRYTADATGTATIKFAPLVPANVSFHVYGFSNREAESRLARPVITAHPQSAIVSPDLPVTFSVAAAGVPLPTYQWRFNGGGIGDATNTTYLVTAASSANAGAYDVVVSNSVGSVTSLVARLTVGIPVANPSFEVDSFSVYPGYVSGNGPITGWASLGGHGINPAAGSPFADNGAIPHGSQVAFMQDAGTNSQTVSGFTVGGQYYVHYYENARTGGTLPGMEVKVGGATVVPARVVPQAGGGNPYRRISSEMFVASATDLELAFVKSNPQGGDTTALIDNVAIIPVPLGTSPSIGVQPQSVTVYLGQSAGFGAIAQGSLPLRYQWRLGGQPVADATNSTLALPTVGLSDEGDYTLVVTNSSGSVTSAVARLSLLEVIPTLRNTGIDAGGGTLPAGAIEPFWTFQVNPDSGSSNVFVANEGWPIQTDVWLLNSATSKWVGPRAGVSEEIAVGDYLYRTTFDLTGRDTNTVLIVGRWASDNGGTAVYVNGTTVSVPLSGAFNAWTTFTITSSNALFLQGTNTIDFGVNNGAPAGATGLRVEFTQTSARTLPGVPAAIALHPQGSKVAEGDTVVLGVTATGTLPITYQWKKDAVNLPGKTASTLTLTAVTTNDSGNYTVAVTNLWGFAISSNATVTVAFRPLPGFFGTGVDASGALLAAGATDPHFILAASADPSYPGPDAVVVNEAWPIAPAGPWVANGPTSKWIAPQPNQNQVADPVGGVNAVGDYTYQTTFNLTGYDVSKISLVGSLAADNSVTDVLVNGVSSGITSPGFDPYTPFTITSGLVAGNNTLDFQMSNAGTAPGPTGLRVNLKGYLNILPLAKLQITFSGANVSISWSPVTTGQKLQWAPDVTGPWTDIPNAPNPYTTTASAAKVFYRIAQ